MLDAGAISWNNYGGMQHELGNFAQASEYFNKDRFGFGNKSLKEPYYYLPMMSVYAGRTKEAINIAKEAIDFSGSTPGFGWYNIALSRAYLYDGQLDSAEYALDKAATFKEIHIGTTLTQSQYDFSVNLLRLQLIERKIGLQKFINKGWWYSPTSLYNIASLKVEKLLLQYILINQLTANPERNRVVYDLFCSESTTSFDEALYLLKDFSPAYFIKKYEKYVQDDTRTNLKRYFRLIQHEMQLQDGDEDEATEGFEQIIKQVTVDTANEKLFLGRLYEGLAKAYDEDGNERDAEFYGNVLIEEYPQLIPFSNLPVKMKLVTSGIDDEATRTIIKELKKCNINWVNDTDANTPVATISFNKRGEKYEAVVNVNSGSRKVIVANEKFVFKPTEGVGREVALRLFGKGGGMAWEKKS
jgi:tetratricopeptide (TPR) repeat protein